MSDIIVTLIQGWLVICFLTPNRMGVVWVAVTHSWLQAPFAFGGCLGLGGCDSLVAAVPFAFGRWSVLL